MAFSHVFKNSYAIPGHTVPAKTTTYTGNNEINFELTIPHGTTTDIDCEIDISTIQSMALYSDKNIVLHAGDGSSAGDGATITLTAGVPRFWAHDSLDDCPFTIDVEKFYFVLGGLVDANVKVFILQEVV